MPLRCATALCLLPLLQPSASLGLALRDAPAPGAVAALPELHWPSARSDWLDVTSGECGGHKAVGDGKADDTLPIQACLDMLNYESANATHTASNPRVTVYLPPGTYRITRTLRIVKILGGAIIGHGETSVLQWAGAQGGILLHDGGVTRTRFVGLVFDGQGIAGVGFGARVCVAQCPPSPSHLLHTNLMSPRGGGQSTTPGARASTRRASGTKSTSSRIS